MSTTGNPTTEGEDEGDFKSVSVSVRSRNVSNASGSSASQKERKLPDGSKGFQCTAMGRGKWFETDAGKAIKLGMQRMKIRSIGSNPQVANFEKISSKLISMKQDESILLPMQVNNTGDTGSASKGEQEMEPSVAHFFSLFTTNTNVIPSKPDMQQSQSQPEEQPIQGPEPGLAAVELQCSGGMNPSTSTSGQNGEETTFEQLMLALQVSSSDVRPMPVAAINEEELHNQAKPSIEQPEEKIVQGPGPSLTLSEMHSIDASKDAQNVERELIVDSIKQIKIIHKTLAEQLSFLESHMERNLGTIRNYKGLTEYLGNLKGFDTTLKQSMYYIVSGCLQGSDGNIVLPKAEAENELMSDKPKNMMPIPLPKKTKAELPLSRGQVVTSNCHSNSHNEDLEEEIIIAKPIN